LTEDEAVESEEADGRFKRNAGIPLKPRQHHPPRTQLPLNGAVRDACAATSASITDLPDATYSRVLHKTSVDKSFTHISSFTFSIPTLCHPVCGVSLFR
jgi:hypothetical protein